MLGLPVDPVLYGFFILATAILVFTPGPIVGLIIAETLSRSARHGFAVVLGAEIAGAFMILAYLIGFTAIIELLSENVLMAIRYLGAAYLMYLAFKAFRPAKSVGDEAAPLPRTPAMAFRTSLAVSMTNPKAILFFAAFFPQFVSPDLPITPQIVTMAITFLIIAPLLDCVWVFAASRARTLLQKRGSSQMISRISGSILALAAVALLFLNK